MTASSRPAREYDGIVVGAGMAGLTFAVLMAQQGKRMLVVEQHCVPGGLFTAFQDRGFLFNVGMEWTTDGGEGGALSRLLERLGVATEYPLQRLSTFKLVHSPDLLEPLELRCSRAEVSAGLGARFPRERAAIERFLDDCETVCGESGQARRVLLESGLRPVRQMLSRYFDDPSLCHLLYGLMAVDGLGVLLMFLVAALLRGELFVPRHFDHRRLPLLLDRRLRAAKGSVLYRRSVDEILVSGGAAHGVRLHGGEELFAPVVVAGVDAPQLYGRMLRSWTTPPRPAPGRPGPSTFCAFLGLGSPLRGSEGRHFSRLLLAPTQEWLRQPDSIETAPLRVELQSALHSRLAPAGKATLCVWASTRMAARDGWGQGPASDQVVDREAYARAKEAALQTVLRRVESALPGVRERIEAVSTASPYTFLRYSRSPEGSVTGRDMASPSYLKSVGFETPVRGLFHVGHWTVQSGVNSVMYSGERLFDALRGQEVSA